jgi:tetratricopeptide (TPR) repeat protein
MACGKARPWSHLACVPADRRRRRTATILGNALLEVRRFEEAITSYQDAAAICREAGDRHREAMALNNLGLALREVGQLEEAIIAHQDAAAIRPPGSLRLLSSAAAARSGGG